ncbi:transposase domain-containing protein [Caballeronia mineralivorans]|uniref:transposase domain-containing protein n=1 Tax=Caballeronia mineralivorans TaxID=2010198 RepID=UPI0023F111F6|nr:transposase domain-containing protein [Caballeronia mineralivorans]
MIGFLDAVGRRDEDSARLNGIDPEAYLHYVMAIFAHPPQYLVNYSDTYAQVATMCRSCKGTWRSQHRRGCWRGRSA